MPSSSRTSRLQMSSCALMRRGDVACSTSFWFLQACCSAGSSPTSGFATKSDAAPAEGWGTDSPMRFLCPPGRGAVDFLCPSGPGSLCHEAYPHLLALGETPPGSAYSRWRLSDAARGAERDWSSAGDSPCGGLCHCRDLTVVWDRLSLAAERNRRCST